MSDFEYISYDEFNESKSDDAETFNYGEVVCCDFCNEGEESKGGVLIGSHAVCGTCCDKNGYYEDDDEIDLTFDKDKTFKQNVLEYRKKVYGTSDAIVTIIPF